MPDTRSVFLLLLAMLTFHPLQAAEPSWHTALSFDGGGIWSKRIPVDITNTTPSVMEGKPVSLVAPLEKHELSRKTLRVVHAEGHEVVFAVHEAVSDFNLTIPVDAEPGKTVRYYIYADNPVAWPIPDRGMLEFKPGLLNGDLETGDGDCPEEWYFDHLDATHRVSWVAEHPKSGRRCLKTVVNEGAEKTWVAARQRQIPITPGARYRMTAYVKAEKTTGSVGWYIHLGPVGKPFTLSPMLLGGPGTYDWKRVQAEFTAPADAAIADLGTVLHGTGTAWYDSVTLEQLDKKGSAVKTVIGKPEGCPLAGVRELSRPGKENWPEGYECRSVYRMMNESETALTEVAVIFELRAFLSHGRIGTPDDILVTLDGRTFPGKLIDPESRQVSATIPHIAPRSVNRLDVYYKIRESRKKENAAGTGPGAGTTHGTAHPELQRVDDPFAGLANLVPNGGFEAGDKGWKGAGSIESDPQIVRFGKRCAKLVMRTEDAGKWRGYTQRVQVVGGRSYLVGAWLRSENVLGGGRVHLHFHDADGKLCKDQGMSSLGQEIHGTSDWVRHAQIVTVPRDAASMVLHLTHNQPGTLWFDNLIVFDSLPAEPTGVESKPQETGKPDVWQVPAVVKVFPQTLPPTRRETVCRIAAARNEKEPLQLAYRFPTGTKSSPRLHLTPLKDASGQTLASPEICEVRYVPVDYPSNYYNTTVPKWYRKTPRSAPRCDGWAGDWPDPLVPISEGQQLPAGEYGTTWAVWLTWSIPREAKSGIYTGKVSIGETTLPVELTVYPFALPDENHVSATYDARFTDPKNIWGPGIQRLAADHMAANRLEIDKITPDLKVRYENGKFLFDWEAFDREVSHVLDELKMRNLYMPHLFYCFGWGHPPKDFFGEKPYPGEWPFPGADRSTLRPEYVAKYQAALREFWNHLKAKGWAEKFVLYISDEPNHWDGPLKDQMIALCKMIHEVDPNIPIYSSTWAYVPEWLGSLDIWGIGHYGLVSVETMRMLVERGDRIWFTTDGMMCLDTPYCAIERLLPHYCFKYGAEAYEFWGIGWLTYDPWAYGFHDYIYQSSTPGKYYWVRYPNGDGYLLYPGGAYARMNERLVASIRFEQAREGVEDYEYLYLLRELIAKSPASVEKIAAAREVLEEARSLVESPTATGRFSSKILPDPKRLEEVRTRLAQAIIELSGDGKK